MKGRRESTAYYVIQERDEREGQNQELEQTAGDFPLRDLLNLQARGAVPRRFWLPPVRGTPFSGLGLPFEGAPAAPDAAAEQE